MWEYRKNERKNFIHFELVLTKDLLFLKATTYKEYYNLS